LISARFPRSFDALDQVFGFTRRFYDAANVADPERLVFDFCVEELFTNLVKYNNGNNEIELTLDRQGDRLVGQLTDFDVEPYDITAAPAVDVTLTAEQRKPGGLGVHLVRRLVDGLEYDYTNRASRITFTKNLG